MVKSYSQKHKEMLHDDPSTAANLFYWQYACKRMILPCAYQSYWVLCFAGVKTLACFAHLLERQCHFDKSYSIYSMDMTNAMHIFFIKSHATISRSHHFQKPQDSVIILQILYAVRYFLFPLCTLGNDLVSWC